MFGLSKRSTRLGSCCCAQLGEKQKQVRQIVGKQRTPLKVVKRRFACKANYRRQTTQPATALSIVVSTASAAKSCTQIRCSSRCGNTSVQNIISRNRPTIITLIRAVACSDHSAFQRSADKKAFRLAVGINRRSRCHIGLSSASHRPRGNAGVHPQRHISTLRKSANSAFVVKHDYKIGPLRADLRSPPGTAGANE